MSDLKKFKIRWHVANVDYWDEDIIEASTKEEAEHEAYLAWSNDNEVRYSCEEVT